MKVTKNSNFPKKYESEVSVLISWTLMRVENLHVILHFLNLDSELSYGRHNLDMCCEDSVLHKSGTQIHGHTASGVQKMPLLLTDQYKPGGKNISLY